MISVFQVFKMVFGVVASVLILYFLITYSTAYGNSQQETMKMLLAKNFRQQVDYAYTTGNPSDSDISGVEGIYYRIQNKKTQLVFGNSYLDVTSPLFFRPGSQLSVTQNNLSFGWWKFGFVEAVPEMAVVFNPLENTEEVWGVMRSITSALPDTSSSNVKTKFRYAFCGYPGSDDVSEPEERFNFEHQLLMEHAGMDFEQCYATLASNQVLVTVSNSCAPNPARGICVKPDGIFYMAGSDTGYVYIDPVDIAAAIIGGTEKDIWGHHGENLYNYKKDMLKDYMKLAADLLAERARTKMAKLSDLVISGRIDAGSDTASCTQFYGRFADALQGLSSGLSASDYYSDMGFKQALSDARTAFDGLVSKGCEVAV